MNATQPGRPSADVEALANLAAEEWFTTGDVGDLCGVSVRTVSKWCDSGELPSRRIPQSTHRRIRRPDLVDFLRRKGMIPEAAKIAGPRVLFCGGTSDPIGHSLVGATIIRVESTFHAGVEATRGAFDAAVFDFECDENFDIARGVFTFAWSSTATIVGLLCEDQTESYLSDFGNKFARVFKRPFDPALLRTFLSEALGLEGGSH